MIELLVFLLTLILAFSYKIVEKLVKLLFNRKSYKFIDALIVYVWGVSLCFVIYIYDGDFVLQLPINYKSTFTLAIVIMIVNIFIAKYPGYKPEGISNTINFVIFYPIIEEIVFRGIMIPLLNKVFHNSTGVEIFNMSVTLSTVISAILFAISHLQYYKLNKTSVRYMFFAFLGGIIFGLIAEHTKSIMIPILLHVEFNFLAAFYSRKTHNKISA